VNSRRRQVAVSHIVRSLISDTWKRGSIAKVMYLPEGCIEWPTTISHTKWIFSESSIILYIGASLSSHIVRSLISDTWKRGSIAKVMYLPEGVYWVTYYYFSHEMDFLRKFNYTFHRCQSFKDQLILKADFQSSHEAASDAWWLLILIRCKHSQRAARSFVRGLEIRLNFGFKPISVFL
jgi:hypothetical protein